jgi:hypothetical protein
MALRASVVVQSADVAQCLCAGDAVNWGICAWTAFVAAWVAWAGVAGKVVLRIVAATFLAFLGAHGVGISVLRGFAAACCGCTRVAFGTLATFCAAISTTLSTFTTLGAFTATFRTFGALATGGAVLLRSTGVLCVF